VCMPWVEITDLHHCVDELWFEIRGRGIYSEWVWNMREGVEMQWVCVDGYMQT
jgi:hypothetical protein